MQIMLAASYSIEARSGSAIEVICASQAYSEIAGYSMGATTDSNV